MQNKFVNWYAKKINARDIERRAEIGDLKFLSEASINYAFGLAVFILNLLMFVTGLICGFILLNYFPVSISMFAISGLALVAAPFLIMILPFYKRRSQRYKDELLKHKKELAQLLKMKGDRDLGNE